MACKGPCAHDDCTFDPRTETATFRGVEVPVTDPVPAGDEGYVLHTAEILRRVNSLGPDRLSRATAMELLGFDVPPDDEGEGMWDFILGFNPGTFQSVFANLFQETFELLVERQRKYGPENISSQGFYGVFTRLASDKVERIRRSMNGKIVEGRIELDSFRDASDETVEDGLLDIANYALILLALKRGLWGRPLEDLA